MVYYEYLRVRKALTIYTLVLIVLAVGIYLIAAFHSHSMVFKVDVHKDEPHAAPLILFTSMAAWITAILATIISTSLNGQRDHLAYTWTRPQSRFAMAVAFIAADVATLVGGFVIVLAIEVSFFSLTTHIPITARDAVGDYARAFGFALMWYAIVQGLSAGFSVRGGTVAGLSWPVFLFAAALEAARFPSPWQEILTAINVFNPMAYVSNPSFSDKGGVALHSIIPFEMSVRVALMYGITVAALWLAVSRWKRMEA